MCGYAAGYRLYVLFVVDGRHPPRAFAGHHREPDRSLGHPTGTQPVNRPGDRAAQFRFFIRDRDGKFSGVFDPVFASEAIRILRTPVRAPRANAIAERWIGTVRRELLDRMLILNQRQLGHRVCV